MDRQPFFDGQTVIGKTEDSGATDDSNDRNDSDDSNERSARNDRNDSNIGAADRDSWPLWLLDSFDGLTQPTEDEQQPPEKVSPHEVLSKMREFCRKFFKTKADDKTKIEWARQFNRYLATITPRLCDRINAEVLDSEPNVVNVSSPSVVFGDIHGNLHDLYDYEQKYWANNDNGIKNYLFLGDFVDRGDFSFEVSIYLFCLKLTDSSKYILVRGNHEVRLVNKGYTFHTECVRKFGDVQGEALWDAVNSSFERLPLAAVVDTTHFCCHGGVPKSISTLAELLRAPKPMVDPAAQSPGAHELLWNDPIESMKEWEKNNELDKSLKKKKVEFVANKARSTAYYFTALAAKKFLDSNGLTTMIRAHENVDQGYKYTSEDRVLTIFSSSNYCGKNNSTSCAVIRDKKLQIVILKKGST